MNKVEKEKLLLVEGKDELRVFNTIISSLNILNIQVIEYKGKTGLSDFLKNVLIKDPKFISKNILSISIIRDADDSSSGAFNSVCSALKNNGLDVPQKISEKTNGNPIISVLILPGNERIGSLEDIFIESVKDEEVFLCVEEYFKCLKEKQGNIPNQIGKAKVHTYLASKVIDPDKRLAESVEANFWNFNHTAFEQLINFIKQL
ncbi:MAG TPA: hypothetical protein PKA80_14890 [Ignavibacteriaceae bacterium]|nr:hypothetical protein [Ignavibacteriaceae bacterium]